MPMILPSPTQEFLRKLILTRLSETDQLVPEQKYLDVLLKSISFEKPVEDQVSTELVYNDGVVGVFKRNIITRLHDACYREVDTNATFYDDKGIELATFSMHTPDVGRTTLEHSIRRRELSKKRIVDTHLGSLQYFGWVHFYVLGQEKRDDPGVSQLNDTYTISNALWRSLRRDREFEADIKLSDLQPLQRLEDCTTVQIVYQPPALE